MWTFGQLGAARVAVDDLRIRASAAYVSARTPEQRYAVEQALNWCSRMADNTFSEVMTPYYSGPFTYARFVDTLQVQHDLISYIDGAVKESSPLATAKRFLTEVVGQSGIDVGANVKEAGVAVVNAAPQIAKGIASSLPWLAIGLGALALIYVAKVVRP